MASNVGQQSSELIYSKLATDSDLAGLVALYVAEMPDKIEQFETCIQQMNWQELRRLAHQMKGAAGSYGFDEVTEYAARLERVLVAPLADVEVQAALDDLKLVCRRIRAGVPLGKPEALSSPS